MTVEPQRGTGSRNWRLAWSIPEHVVYLNHGAFGPTPNVVRRVQREWMDRVAAQPMETFLYHQEAGLRAARARLARWLGAAEEDLVLLDNATAGMNVVATSVALNEPDEVLITDHAYGAIRRVWERACRRDGAQLVTVALPFPPESPEQLVDAVCAKVTPRTKLAVLSHVTSPTAMILPVGTLCKRLNQMGVATCIDGPHGPAHRSLDLQDLDCDYYTASLHKWACAPAGTGFLYVHPRAQARVEPLVLSWGRLVPTPLENENWTDEFWWAGTRDLSAYLAIPAAIDFLESAGLDEFRASTHELAVRGRELIDNITGIGPPLSAADWHGSMVLAELPPGDPYALRDALHHRYAISAQIVPRDQRRFVRISCHLYNTTDDLEALARAMAELLKNVDG